MTRSDEAVKCAAPRPQFRFCGLCVGGARQSDDGMWVPDHKLSTYVNASGLVLSQDEKLKTKRSPH
jgi:hypothetical protein